MKKILLFASILFAVNLSFGQTEEEMAAWQNYMVPSEAHKAMAMDNGIWDTKNTMWMSPDPNVAPVVSKGTSTNTMILGGRYQQSTFEGNFNGMPMNGLSTLAYDNQTKEYINTWIDNFGTGMMILKGKMSDDKKTINFKGEMVDPMTGKVLDITETFTFIDADTHKMEMYMDMGGQNFKMMEIIFTRRK